MKKIFSKFLLLVLINYSYGYTEEITLFFSCLTSNDKRISLYGIPDKKNGQLNVQYRFGNKKRAELVYPESFNNKLFTYTKYFRSQTEYFRIFFTNGDYAYTLYRNYYGDEQQPVIYTLDGGIIVLNKKTGKEYDIQCATIEVDQLYKIPDFIEEDQEGRL